MRSPLKIGIVGTVGVPARYGGFETLAEQLSKHITPLQAELVIYCQRSAYPEVTCETDKSFAGHRRIFMPLRANGAMSMVHDVLTMLHAAVLARVDVMLVLGYSGAWALPLLRLLRPSMRIVTNIDGMEWRRDKFGVLAKRLLRWLETSAVHYSDTIIADNSALAEIARRLYPNLEPLVIPYGGDHTLVTAGVMPLVLNDPFYLSIARIEPENNCHLILEAFDLVGETTLVFVGNWGASSYSRSLKARYAGHNRIHLLSAIYDLPVLAALRSRSYGYVHGHSVGGTNPSLVEAIFHSQRICSFDCAFNRSTLDGQGAYFDGVNSLIDLLRQNDTMVLSRSVQNRLRERYRWDVICDAYLAAFFKSK